MRSRVSPTHSASWLGTLLALAPLAACNGTAPTSATTLDASAVALSIVSGNAQKAPVNTNAPAPLRVRVLDRRGRPVPDFVVNFVVTSGGGSVFGPAEQTNDQGYAEDIWTLGPRLGSQTVAVRSVNATTGQAETFGQFTATGLPPRTIPIVFTSPRARGLPLQYRVGEREWLRRTGRVSPARRR